MPAVDTVAEGHTNPRDPVPARGRPSSTVVAVTLVVAAAIGAIVVLTRAGRGLSFHFDDEWLMITQRRDLSLDDVLRPHGAHLMAIPVLIYNVLFRIVGLRSYVPYQVVLGALHLTVCGLLFAYLRRRASVWYAAGATVVLLFLGTAWQDVLWAFQMQYLLSLATGIAALLLLERRTRTADAFALVALVAAAASSGAGLVFVLGAMVELVWSRADRRRLWVPLAPLALWGLWAVVLGSSRGTLDNLVHTPEYVVDEAGAAMAALAGSSQTVGVVLAGVVTIIVVVAVVRAWPIDGRYAACITMVLGLWLLLAYGRDLRVPTTEGRYTYLGATVLLLLGAEVLAHWKPFGVPRPARIGAVAVLVAAVAVSMWVNVGRLHDGADEMRFFAMQYRTAWSSLDLAGSGIDRSAQVSYLPESHDLTVGSVLDAVHDLDFPLLDRDQLFALSPDWRIGADYTLAYAAGLQDRDPGGRRADGPCTEVEPTDGVARLALHGERVSVLVEGEDAPVEVRARVVGDDFTDFPFATLRRGQERLVRLQPIDLGPWDVELRSTGPFRACPAT